MLTEVVVWRVGRRGALSYAATRTVKVSSNVRVAVEARSEGKKTRGGRGSK